MIYRFEDFELDTDAVELHAGATPLPLEPQVFALLLLIENRERMVSRDEIIEKVWDGRVVSDSAMSSRVKTLRRALGDDGSTQRVVRTVHGRGFRFVFAVQTAATSSAPAVVAAATPAAARPAPASDGKTSIAVPHELIAVLSRLRWLFVIARGSSFRLRGATPDVHDVGRLLNVDYCVSGALEILGRTLVPAVELADTRSGAVVWSERFACAVDGVHEVRAQIVAKVVVALELRIPLDEARAARTSVPEDLDAWAAYHLGLEHMYRFNRQDNALATARFEQALARAPDFARAHAGLSFTHFQNAFLLYTADPVADAAQARAHAERGLALDALDPFVNFTLGRSFWLTGELDAGMVWLERATALSPSYAQGIYAQAWADAIAGRGDSGRTHADHAMALSPLDPLLYAMQATRALALLADGDTEAALWTERAAAWTAVVRARRADFTAAHFLRAFPFTDAGFRERIGAALAACGLH